MLLLAGSRFTSRKIGDTFWLTYRGDGTAGWAGSLTERAKLTASDEEDDEFGTSVAISGDTVVVGAYGDDIGAIFNQGSAYVFGLRTIFLPLIMR